MSPSIRRLVLITVTAALFASLPALAQSNRLTQFITGKIFADMDTSRLLADIPIEVCVDKTTSCTTESAWRSTRSNDLGRFLIANLSPGDYTVQARFASHASVPELVHVRPGRFVTVDLVLEIDEGDGAQTVIVPQVKTQRSLGDSSPYPARAEKLDLDEYWRELQAQGAFSHWTREEFTEATTKVLDLGVVDDAAESVESASGPSR